MKSEKRYKNNNKGKIKYVQIIACLILCFSAKANTLEKAILNAINNDPSIKASKLIQLSNEENIILAKSRLLPQISLQGSSNQLTQTTSQDTISGGNNSRSFSGPSVNHQLILKQALIKPKELSYLQYAELQSQYMNLKVKSDISELKIKVVNAWVELIGARKIAQALAKPIPFMLQAVEQEKSKFLQGDGTKDAVKESYSQYIAAKNSHKQAIELLSNKLNILKKLTGIEDWEIEEIEEFKISSISIVEEDKNRVREIYIDKALDIKMSKIQEKMQLIKIKMAEDDHKPTLEIIAALNVAKNDATSTQGYRYKNQQVGLQYIIPIYAGGATNSSIKQAGLIYRASLEDANALLLRIEMEFENSWSQLSVVKNKIESSLISLESSRVQENSTKRGYELGVKTIMDVSTVNNIISRKEVELIQNYIDYEKLVIKLMRLDKIMDSEI